MASLKHIRQRKKEVRVGGKIYRYGERTFWRVVYRIWLPDGRVVERSRETRKKSQAVLLLDEAEKLEVKSQRGVLDAAEVRRLHSIGLLRDEEARLFLGHSPRLSWDDLLAGYEKSSRVRCRPEVHEVNMVRARKVAAFFSRIRPDQLTPADVERWMDVRKMEGAANSTVNHELNVLRQMLDLVWEKHANPARKVMRLSSAKMGRLPRALTPDEDEQAMRLAYANRHLLGGNFWRLYLVFRFAGLRRSEARFLPWNHVLEDRILVQEVDLDPGELGKTDRLDGNIWRPKEGDARSVPVPRWVLEELSKGRGEGRLVFSRNGRVLSKSEVTYAFNRVLRQISPDLTLHDLRHTYVTELMEKGVAPARVQKLAGHKILSTTEPSRASLLAGARARLATMAKMRRSTGVW